MKITPMRGQVVVRELPIKHSNTLWTPTNPRDVRIHRGTVLAFGAPMRTLKGAAVPYDFSVGDVVLFSHVQNEKAFTQPWPEDGLPATWIPQWVVSAVLDEQLAQPNIATEALCKTCLLRMGAHHFNANHNGRLFCPDEVHLQ